MEHKDFLEKTIMTFDVVAFQTAKRNLIGEYLNYEFVNENDITKALLAEKTNDYFVIVEQKTFKTFDKLVTAYTKNLIGECDVSNEDLNMIITEDYPDFVIGKPLPKNRQYFL